jgi:hypothetical protein
VDRPHSLDELPARLRGTMMRKSVTVASLNIRGVPLTGSRLTARCQAIGAFFEGSGADVVCFQEVHTYYHLRQLARQMPSFRYASFRRTLPGPAGDVVTFSRLPMSATAYHGFGAFPHAPGIPLTAGEIKAEDTEVLFSGRQVLRGGTGYLSDHLGLLARLNCPGA